MVQVSLKKWEKLSSTERKLAESLGVTPSRPKPAGPKGAKPKPYVLQAEMYCYLCTSKATQLFHMVLKEGVDLAAPHLESKKITKQEAQRLKKKLPFRVRDIEVSACSICPEILGKWKKEELVRKLIQVFPVARAVLVSGGKV